MPWKLIYVSFKDDVTNMADTPVQWNFLPMVFQAVETYGSKYARCGQRKSFAMGINTFRRNPCTCPGPVYVFSRCFKPNDNPNIMFVGSMYDIPKNDFLDVWFLGSNMILECLSDLMQEIIHIKICASTAELWPNLLGKNKCKTFKIPQGFSAAEYFFKDTLYLSCLGKKVLVSVARHEKKEIKVSCSSLENGPTHHLDKLCLLDNPLSCTRFVSPYTETIDCKEGFPVFHFNLQTQSMIIDDTFSFLKGAVDQTAFCKHFDLIRSVYPQGSSELEPITASAINEEAFQRGVVSVLDTICIDQNFLTTSQGRATLLFKPLLMHASITPWQCELIFHQKCDHVTVSLVTWVGQCNLVDDYPYVVVSASSFLLAVCHYLSNHCTYPLVFRAENVSIQMGRLFFFYNQELFIRSYQMCPVLLAPFVRPLASYTSYDFSVHLHL